MIAGAWGCATLASLVLPGFDLTVTAEDSAGMASGAAWNVDGAAAGGASTGAGFVGFKCTGAEAAGADAAGTCDCTAPLSSSEFAEWICHAIPAITNKMTPTAP